MSQQFEFLRSLNIGQYLPLGSPIHRLDPRARLVGLLFLVMALTFTRSGWGVVLGILVALALTRVGRVPLRFALQGLVGPLPFLLILAVLQVFFNAVPDSGPVFFRIGAMVVGLSDLGAGVILLGRFAALILTLSLGAYTLSTGELTLGLGYLFRPLARVGLPAHDFVMMLQISIRFLPLLAQTAERIAKSQAARGADWDARGGNLIKRARRIVPLIVPLFVTSLHRAENMALAMDARGYGSVERRTSRIQLNARPQDWAAIIFAFMIAVVILILP
jgi:energy-coupling factor transport system permease protein